MEFSKFFLKDVCIKITDGSHSSPVAVEDGYPMHSVKDMTNYGFDYSKVKRISEKDYLKLVKGDCRPLKNDVLIAKDGSYLKHVFVQKEEKEEVILSSIAILRPNLEKIHPEYLAYYLRNPEVKQTLKNGFVSGSVLPRIVLKDFKKLDIYIPEKDEQSKIVKVLSSIDEKIMLNNTILKNMEELCSSLYKQWFINFEFPNEQGIPYRSSGGEMVESELGEIPKGWKVKALGHIANVKGGKRLPKGETVQEKLTNHPYIRVKDFINQTLNRENINYITPEIFEKIKNYTISSDDIYISVAGTVGLTGLIPKMFSGSNLTENANKITPLDKTITKYFILEFLNSTIGKEQIKSKVVGSTQPKLPLYAIKDIKIIIPEKKILNKINSVLEKIYVQKEALEDNNQILGELRNMLIPKLLSGEIEIPDESVVESS